ncbi:transposable element Tcb1 transposase [Trichonephila clavipes]|nr:transposable element Tcb1 transposase [Trichonephila clavipes]
MWVAEWKAVLFTDESRICLQYHDGWIRVWRHRGERMLNSYVMHHHTAPAPGIMVWGGIEYHSHTPLVRIAGTLNSQHYISEVLEPVVLPYFQDLATAIFQQDNARPHMARIGQKVLRQSPDSIASLASSLSGSFADRRRGPWLLND